ncbi:MAG TPA: extracellular solute-binding protein, partial [Candidatus Limnocylindrales bacterium]|nr:extracellular solute-binding protein [Candidatus Limnocylindrales bacterium]
RLLVALVGLALIGGSCGGAPSASPAPSLPTSNGPLADPSAPTPVTITVRDHQDLHLQAMATLLPQFEQAMAARGQPVHVVLQSGPDDDVAFVAQLEADDAAGRGPDLTSFPPPYVPALVAAGDLLDLTDRLVAWPDWSAHFYPLLRARAVQQNGRIYSVPRGANVIQLFYWPAVLSANGIATNAPASWDDLVARMVALRAATGRPPLLIPSGASWGSGGFIEGFSDLILAAGGTVYCPTGDLRCPDHGGWVVRGPAVTTAFDLYAELVKDGLLPVQPLLGADPWTPTKYFSFPAGQLAVTTQGTWGWTFDWGPDGHAPIPDLVHRVKTWPFPTTDGQSPFVYGAENWMWAIAADSAHPDLAFELLQWLTTGPALAQDIAAVGNLSPRDDIDGVPPYRDVPYLAEGDLLRAGVARSFPTRPGLDEVGQAAAQATQQILLRRLDGPGAADLFARTVTAALGQDAVVDVLP